MRNLLFNEWGWKLFSLVLAVAIWFTANRILHEKEVGATDPTVTSITFNSLPVEVVSAALDVSQFRVAPGTIKVTVNGPLSAMNKLQASDLHVTVAISATGLTQPSMLPVEISLPPQIAILSVEPGRVFVSPAPVKEKLHE